MGRLDGKVALVTGAASGLGYATALRFAQEGAVVAGLDLTDPRKAAEGAETGDWAAVESAGPATSFLTADITDEDAVAAAVAEVAATHGGLDVVAHAAGVAGGGPVHLLEMASWQRVIDVNLTGSFLVGKHAVAQMIRQQEASGGAAAEQGGRGAPGGGSRGGSRGGSIVLFASIEGLHGTEGGSVYNASKGAVVLLTRNMAIDYGRRGIRVNCVCPGFVDTPMFRATMASPGMARFRDRYRDEHKLGRFGEPAEIAAAALFLASDDASFVTGHALAVDGGFTAGMRAGVLEPLGL